MKSLRSVATSGFKTILTAGYSFASPRFELELRRRNDLRRQTPTGWFTPEEAQVVEALAKLIVPSDDESPGIEDICTLGSSALAQLDQLLRQSRQRQYYYSRGLFAFDCWAVNKFACKFWELSKEDQALIFRKAQNLHELWVEKSFAILKAMRRFRIACMGGQRALFAAKLYPIVVRDCVQIFYTSRVSWVWLGYDGPPMEKGYPILTEPR